MNLADLAVKLKTPPATIKSWLKIEGFPKSAVNLKSDPIDYDYDKIANWLKRRPVGTRGRLPAWVAVVGHKGRPAPSKVAKKAA